MKVINLALLGFIGMVSIINVMLITASIINGHNSLFYDALYMLFLAISVAMIVFVVRHLSI